MGESDSGLIMMAPLAVIFLIMLGLLVSRSIPLGYTVRNIGVRWLTTGTTAFAFILVTALLTVMLAFVNGMYRLTESGGRGDNVMILSEGATDEGQSNLNVNDISNVERDDRVARDPSGKSLASRELYLVVTQPIQSAGGFADAGGPGAPKRSAKRRFTQVRGVEDPVISGAVHGIELLPGGEWFGDAGVEDAKAGPDGKIGLSWIQVAVGEGVAGVIARDLGKERLEVGDAFPLGVRTAVVKGIMNAAGTTFNSEIWAKKELVGKQFNKETTTTITVRAKSPADAESLRDFIANDFKEAQLTARVEKEYFKGLSTSNLQFLIAAIVLAIFMAVGGVFGVLNTMFASVSQRRKDIGVLRIVGFSRISVLGAFLLEALILALLGGLLGLALGSLSHGLTANSVVSSGGASKFVVLQLTVDWRVLTAGLLFSMIMGLIGGLFPAISAMRLRPLESLR